MSKNISNLILSLITITLVASPFSLAISQVEAAVSKKVIGNLAYWDQARGFKTIQENSDVLSEVSPNWYRINSQGDVVPALDGNGRPYVDQTIISYLKERNIKIVPMIQNLTNEGWSGALVTSILNNTTLRDRHIASIVNLVVQAGYDGIDIDYEDFAASNRDAFSTFMSKLSVALHAQNKILSVDVYPKVNEPGYWYGTQSQDWTALGSVVDEFRIMLYGHSWAGSPAGAISPLAWNNDVLAFAGSVMPASKVVHGIASYGIDWPVGSSGTEHMWTTLTEFAAAYGSVVNWDGVSMSPWFTYSKSGILHTVWFENAQSTKLKLEVTEAKNVSGIFIWRLGGEDPAIWNTIRTSFGGTVPTQPPPAPAPTPTPTPPPTQPTAPTAVIRANNTDTAVTIPYSASAQISWTSTNATSCSVSPTGWSTITNTGISTGNLLSSTTYTLTCNGAGGTATDNVLVTVTPQAPAPTPTPSPTPLPPPTNEDSTAPIVYISDPIANSELSKRTQIVAVATDNVKVTKVIVQVDGYNLAVLTSAPFQMTWNTQKVTSGLHTIRATAYDAEGNIGVSLINVVKP